MRAPLSSFSRQRRKAILDNMLEAGVIQSSVKDSFPLPLIKKCMDTPSGNKETTGFQSLALMQPIKMHPDDMKKTVFITKYGLFEVTRMVFGLCNAPATFARAINLVLHRLNGKIAHVFLDDVLVLGKTEQECLDNLRHVLELFCSFGLKFKPRKCGLFRPKVEFLGRTVCKVGVEMGDQYLEAFREWPIPKDVKAVQRFLFFANYHRSYITHFSIIAAPLHDLTEQKGFQWEGEKQTHRRIRFCCLLRVESDSG